MTELPKREVLTMIVLRDRHECCEVPQMVISPHHDGVAKRFCGLFRTPNRTLSYRTLTIRAPRLHSLALQCV